MFSRLGLGQLRIFADRYYWLTAGLMARSALAKQYRNSYLGMVWTLLRPLSMVLVYAMIMPLIAKVRGENYPVYIVVTLPLWGLISSSLIESHSSLLSQAETLKRCMISSTLFPVSDMLRNVYTYFIAFYLMYSVIILFGYSFSWYVLLWPIYFIPVFITLTAIAIGISYASPYVRDIGDVITVIMNMMVWFSAVIYPLSTVPAWVQSIMIWNPFYILMEPLIALAYHHQLPDMFTMVRLFGVMSLALVFGYSIFRICRRNYVYYL